MKDILVEVCNPLLLSKLPARCVRNRKPCCGSRRGTARMQPWYHGISVTVATAEAGPLFPFTLLICKRWSRNVTSEFHFPMFQAFVIEIIAASFA